MISEVEGLIIKETPYGETSKIINVFTKEYGTIGIMCKGAKSLKSKLRSSTIKLTYGKFYIYYKENKLSLLSNVDIINPLKNIKSDICPLDKESCYYIERYRSADDTNNGKKKLLTMQVFHNEVHQLRGIDYLRTDYNRYINAHEYNNFIQICNTATNGITNYNGLYSHIKSLEDKLESVELYYNECTQVKNNLSIIKNALLHQKEAIKKYNTQYGSDDNDNSRREKYNHIISNAEFLYTTTVE